MKTFLIAITAFLQAYLLFPLTALAAAEGLSAGTSSLTAVGTGISGAGQSSLTTLVGRGINAILAILGIVCIGFVIYAGYLYLMDQGGGEGAKKAKKLLGSTIIGMVIIIAAYAITTYVLAALTTLGASS